MGKNQTKKKKKSHFYIGVPFNVDRTLSPVWQTHCIFHKSIELLSDAYHPRLSLYGGTDIIYKTLSWDIVDLELVSNSSAVFYVIFGVLSFLVHFITQCP